MCQTTLFANNNNKMTKEQQNNDESTTTPKSSDPLLPEPSFTPKRHDFITTLVATLNIPPYSMLVCMGIYFCLIYATIHWSLTNTRAILILYMLHAIFWDGTAQSKTKPKWVQFTETLFKNNFLFRLTAQYFSCQLHPPSNKSELFDSEKGYIFAYHPHGIIGMGASLGLSTDASGFHSIFPGMRRSGVTLNVTFFVPFFKDWLFMNGFCSANKSTLLSRLSGNHGQAHKESIVLIPGGAAEALHCKPKTMKLCIRKRKGFIKLAMETKAAIVPCIGFGENDIFDTIYVGDDPTCRSKDPADWSARTFVWKLQRFLYKKFSFSTPLWTHLIPLAHPIDVVIGKPMEFSGDLEPANVEKCHAQYLKAVQALYDEHKAKYGYEDVPLEFV